MHKGKKRAKWQVLSAPVTDDHCAPAAVKKLKMGARGLAQFQERRAQERQEEWEVMSTTNRQNLFALQQLAANDADEFPGVHAEASILDGTAEAQTSHAGGEHGGETLEDIIELTERARTQCRDT
ncbi:hypothetical protein FB45DRAFT_1021891 [Roridomyces roridus]|uniref:Uncharacterized protein n=1 Tax=Roridomyces roridus TaxID=1738132 RepID=A0AAD7FSK5_9AGAR|nr:hypothetical protein FB45DRAFT_1021891 [Roridomyces roridus]